MSTTRRSDSERGGPTVDQMERTVAKAGERDAAEPIDLVTAVLGTARIGRYALLRKLGEGGMGAVYAGYDEELHRKVAIKLLHVASSTNAELRARMLREAQAMARVSHPNVVNVYEVGESNGEIFIAMEFINGTTLTKWQSEPGRSWQEILHMYCLAGQGLLAAHHAGIVHRDFKPDNVLIGSDGQPRVADFGLARLQDTLPEITDNKTQSSSDFTFNQAHDFKPMSSPLTKEGALMGTPLYMSPEQYKGHPADSRSDQFSFCVALYEALYKHAPFAGTTLAALGFNVVSGRVQAMPTDTQVPSRLHEALLRGLANSPEQRFPAMAELLTALAFDPERDPAAAPHARRWIVIGLVTLEIITQTGGPALRRLLGVGLHTSSLIMCSTFFLVIGLLTFWLRQTLLTNAFHRGVIMICLVYLGQRVLIRMLGFSLGLSLSQIIAFDEIAMATAGGTMAAIFLPSVWLFVPLPILGAALATHQPETARLSGSLVGIVSTIIAVLLWSRAARVPLTGPADSILSSK